MSQAAGGSSMSSYNSLLDKNLSGYFANTRMRKHLVKSGLITKDGQITSDNAYRLKIAKKEHREHVRELLANAIVEKALDMERMRQHEIRKKLDELYKIELVQKVRSERSLKTSDELYALLSPRSRRRRKYRTVKSAAVTAGERSQTKLPDIHFDERSKRLTYESGSTLDSDSSSRFASSHPKKGSHIRSKSASAASFTGKTPHPPPPKTKKKKKRKIHRGLMLARSEQLVAHRVQVQSMAEVTMKFLGSPLQLTNDMFPTNKLSEVQVIQQHCGASTVCVFRELLPPNTVFTFVSRRHRGSPFGLTINIDGIKNIRISSCCEYKHKPGYRIGGKNSQFGLIAVQGASPCYRCQVRLNLIDGKEDDLDKGISSDEEAATRSFDVIVSRGGKREEVKRPVSANATTQTDGEEEFPKVSKDGVKLPVAGTTDEYQDDFYEDEEEEDGNEINDDMSSSDSDSDEDSDESEEEKEEVNKISSKKHESESESESDNDEEDDDEKSSIVDKEQESSHPENEDVKDPTADDVTASDMEKSSELEKSSDVASSESESETEEEKSSSSEQNSEQQYKETEHVTITEEDIEQQKSDISDNDDDDDDDSDNRKSDSDHTDDEDTKAIKSGSSDSESESSDDEEDEKKMKTKDDIKPSNLDENTKQDDGDFDGKTEDDRETTSSMTIVVDGGENNSDREDNEDDDDRENFDRSVPSIISRESTTLTGNEDGRCDSENKKIQFNEEVDVVRYEKVDDESAADNTPRSDEEEEEEEDTGEDFDEVKKKGDGERVMLADLGDSFDDDDDDDDDDEIDIQAQLVETTEDIASEPKSPDKEKKEEEEEEEESDKEEHAIESDNSDLDHRYFDNGRWSQSDQLDDPAHLVLERKGPEEPIESMIDDFKNIDLVNVSFSKEQMKELLAVLRENKDVVQSFSVRNCRVDGDGMMEMLKDILKTMDKLIELNLSDNDMTSEDCMHLADVITNGQPNFRSIILHGNPIRDEGIKILLKALSNSSNIKSLDVGHTGISNDGAECILDYLMNNNILVELTLSNNEFSKEGFLFISSALKCNHSLKTLSLDNNNIGDEELAVICQGISQNKSLRCLDIERNVFTDEGGEQLYTAVECCETLVDVTIQPSPNLFITVEDRIRELIDNRVSELE